MLQVAVSKLDEIYRFWLTMAVMALSEYHASASDFAVVVDSSDDFAVGLGYRAVLVASVSFAHRLIDVAMTSFAAPVWLVH